MRKDQVRAASDLVAIVQETVELKPRGHEFWGCCPSMAKRRRHSHYPCHAGVALLWLRWWGWRRLHLYHEAREPELPSQSVIWPTARVLSCMTPEIAASAVLSVRESTICAPRLLSSTTPCLCVVRTAVRVSTLPAAAWVATSRRRYCLGFAPGPQRAGIAPVPGGFYSAGDDRCQRCREPRGAGSLPTASTTA